MLKIEQNHIFKQDSSIVETFLCRQFRIKDDMVPSGKTDFTLATISGSLNKSETISEYNISWNYNMKKEKRKDAHPKLNLEFFHYYRRH